MVDTEGTAKVDEAVIEKLVHEIFPLTPKGIIKHLKLKRPIYEKTARNGHFGQSHSDFTWEKTDMVNKLRKAAGLKIVRKKVAKKS